MSAPVLTSIDDRLLDAVEHRLDEEARVWLASVRADLVPAFDENRFLTAYSAAARRLRETDGGLSAQLESELRERGLLATGAWMPVRAVRSGLLVKALSLRGSDEAAELGWKVFRTGDSDERIALLGALPLCASPESHVELAIDACRTHVTKVFEAIACDNPYPSRFFPDASFNQMVLKAVFIDVPLDRIAGLDTRMNGELYRMATDYADERAAAGRLISNDLAMLTSMAGYSR